MEFQAEQHAMNRWLRRDAGLSGDQLAQLERQVTWVVFVFADLFPDRGNLFEVRKAALEHQLKAIGQALPNEMTTSTELIVEERELVVRLLAWRWTPEFESKSEPRDGFTATEHRAMRKAWRRFQPIEDQA